MKTDLEIHLNAPEGASGEELAAYIEEACGGDEALRARVEALFAADEHGAGFMAEDPAGDLLVTERGTSSAEAPGDVIGNYKLLQQIGVGGFGVVYMAQQLRPVKRRVALKIIKLGMDTRQVVARFEAERQALAMMDHPNIAKVHDAGATETGRPYFVMELVRGVPITEFCDENNLSNRERLVLFIKVCQAVQHAHQKGVIHRDLKPSNVMVTLHDDKAVPKVIDFGVAKATQMELTDKTLFTHYEQFIGTPAYMSPEQAQMSGLDIDTRSDIYALGVLLYELLTGTTPFDSKALAKAGMDEVRRVIREEEPPRPSLRLSTMGGAARTHLAKQHKTAPDKLMGLVRGDLDWIAMKALEKDRTRRYETANGLAEDIRRHLADEPVSAAAPSPAYRIAKYVRRHRAGLGVAAVITLLLVAGTAVSSWLARSTWRANQELTQTSAKLEEQLGETEEARAIAEAAQVQAKDAQSEAERERRVLAFQLADEDPVRGRLELVRDLRENADDHVVAERVTSSLWQRGSIQPLSPPFVADQAAITRDGKHAVLGHEDAVGTLWIVDAETGEPVSSKVEGGSPILTVGFSFDLEQRWIITKGIKLPERVGLVEVWEWKNEDGSVKEQPLRVGLFLHDNFLIFTELSPDGTMILAGSQGWSQKAGCVWRIEPGEGVTPLGEASRVGNRDNHNMESGCWSPDGTRVATAGTPSGIWQIDEIREGRVVGEPVTNRGQPHATGIKSIRFSPDGEWVVTASHDGTAQVWDARTGEPIGKRLIHAEVASFAEFSPDGGRVLTASFDRTVRIWDAKTGEPLLPAFRHPGGVEEARFSPDGDLVMSDCEDDHFRLWSAMTGELVDMRVGKMRGEITTTTHGRLADGGRKVLIRDGRGRDREKQVWPLLRSEARHQVFRHRPMTIWEHPGKILAADFHPTEPLLVSASRDPRVPLWNRNSGELHQSLHIPTQARKPTVRFSSDGDRFLVATTDEGLRVSDRTPSGWAAPRRFGERKEDLFAYIAHADFSPLVAVADGSRRSRWIVSCKIVQQKAEVWDAESAELKATLQLGPEGGGWCNFASFSHDGTRVVATDTTGAVHVWEGDWERGEKRVRKIVEFNSGGGWQGVAFFHPTDPNRVLCASGKRNEATIRVIDPATNKAEVAHRFKHDRGVPYAEWSPDGAWVVTASHDGSAQVWDAGSGEKVGEPLRHGDAVVVRAEFSPDGRRVVTACQNGTARVWDSESGYPLSDLLEHHSPVNFARFSPDGRQVVTTGDDATVRLWDVPPAPPGPAPVWLPGFLETVSGMRIEADGSVTGVDWAERKKVQAEIEALKPDDYYARVAQWYYQDPETRPITPFSKVTLDQYVANRIRENTEFSLKEALQAAPGNAEALMALAGLTAKVPMQNVDILRLAAHHARAAARAGSGDAEDLAATIARKLRFAQAKERIGTMSEQARDCLEAGQVAEGTSLLVPALVGSILLAAESDGRPLSEFPGALDESVREWVKLLQPDSDLMVDLELKLEPSAGELLSRLMGEDHAAVVSTLQFSMPEIATPERRQRWDAALAKHVSPEATAEDLEFRVRVRAALGQWNAAQETVEALLARFGTSSAFEDVRQRRRLLRIKGRLLEAAGKSAEAKAARAAATVIPPRDPQLDDGMIDLTEHYSGSFFGAKEPAPDSADFWLERLADLYEAGGGPTFDIRGRIQLNSGSYPDDLDDNIAGKDFNVQTGLKRPMKIEGLTIGRRAAKLHFLQSCRWGREEPGVEVACYIVHYEDGSSERIPVIYGTDVADLWIHNRQKDVVDGLRHIAWEQDFQAGNGRGTLALTRQTWENPHPGKTITHIDFESTGKMAAPFLVAITAE